MKDLTIMGNTGKRMSSLEIAEMLCKKHFHVMRDIEGLIDQGAISQLSFELSTYINDRGKEYPMYMLDFDATMTLITGYDARRTMVCRKRRGRCSCVYMEWNSNCPYTRAVERGDIRCHPWWKPSNGSHFRGWTLLLPEQIRQTGSNADADVGCWRDSPSQSAKPVHMVDQQ